MTSGPLQFRVSDRYCQCYDYIDVVYRITTVYKLIYFKYQHWILWFDCDSDTLIVIIRECICYWKLWYLLTPQILIDTLMFHPKRPYSQIDRMPSTLAAMLSLFAALRSAGSWGTPQRKVIQSPRSVGRKRPRETPFQQRSNQLPNTVIDFLR